MAANNKLLCICLLDRTSCYSSALIEIGRSQKEREVRGERHPLPTGTHGYQCVLWSFSFSAAHGVHLHVPAPHLFPPQKHLNPLDEVQGWHGFSSRQQAHGPSNEYISCKSIHFGVFGYFMSFYWSNRYQMTSCFIFDSQALMIHLDYLISINLRNFQLQCPFCLWFSLLILYIIQGSLLYQFNPVFLNYSL